MCIGAVVLARVERVVFGVWDPKAGACGSVLNIPEERLNHRVQIVGGVLEQESRELLQQFFKGLREKNSALEVTVEPIPGKRARLGGRGVGG